MILAWVWAFKMWSNLKITQVNVSSLPGGGGGGGGGCSLRMSSWGSHFVRRPVAFHVLRDEMAHGSGGGWINNNADWWINPYDAEILWHKPWRPKGFLIRNQKCLRLLLLHLSIILFICLPVEIRKNGTISLLLIEYFFEHVNHFGWQEYPICYGSTAIINILILSVRGPTLDVRIWRLKSVPASKGLTN